MTKEAKIKQFKYAFGKPKHPDKNALKAKVALEKAVTAHEKGQRSKWRFDIQREKKRQRFAQP